MFIITGQEPDDKVRTKSLYQKQIKMHATWVSNLQQFEATCLLCRKHEAGVGIE